MLKLARKVIHSHFIRGALEMISYIWTAVPAAETMSIPLDWPRTS
jgi:hypothetical protein